MDSLRRQLTNPPWRPRVIPFVVFLLLTSCQGWFGDSSRYWFYLAKTITAAFLLWPTWKFVPEMRFAFSWLGVGTGILVFALWVGLDGFYPKMGSPGVAWNPNDAFGQGTPAAWFFIAARLAGSTLLVPLLEEAFFRSFFYRTLIRGEFQSVPLATFQLFPFVAVSVVFGFEHYQWLPGILCGLAFQGLVCLKGRLGDAITAHAVANFLLGLWVIGRGAWNFW